MVVEADNRPGSHDAPTSYILFGRNTEASDIADFPAEIDLEDNSDVRIIPVKGDITRNDASGIDGAPIGDLNGDEIDDFIVGAYKDNENGDRSGAAHVVFGGNLPTNELVLTDLNGSNGFTIYGANAQDKLGNAVADIGDFNGDGFLDIAASAYHASNNGREGSGSVYIIFGKGVGPYQASYEISQFNQVGSTYLQGVRIDGAQGKIEENPETEEIEEVRGDHLGLSVSSAGDFNGDGYSDVVVSAFFSNKFYLIFGGDRGGNPLPKTIDLAEDSNDRWIKFDGASTHSFWFGNKIGDVGDINDDGLTDIIIGSSTDDNYVIYGQADGIDVSLENNTLEVSAAGGDDVEYFWKTYEDTNGDDIPDVTSVVAVTKETGRTYTPTESATMRVQAVFTDYNGETASLQTNDFDVDVDDTTGVVTITEIV